MNILWLSHLIPYPPKGGVLQRSYHLLRELAKHHEVDLLAFNQRTLMEPMFKNIEAGVQEAKEELSEFCVNVEFFEIPSEIGAYGKYILAFKSLTTPAPYNINWLKSSRFQDKVEELCAQKRYDIVHFDTISLIPYYSLCEHAVTILDHHNIESHMLLRRAENENNLLKKLYFWQEGKRLTHYERKFCPKFSLNITCSEIDSERLRSFLPSVNVEDIPNGVDTDYFIPSRFVPGSNGETSKKQSILFIGTLDWYPNAEAVFFIVNQIWPTLKKLHPNITVDIIGANPAKELVDFAENNADFHVHGFVDDILPFLNEASVYVCPIKDGGGTKLKILDAMAMGNALVVHPIACEGIAVENGEHVVFAESADEFVSEIGKLLVDSPRAMRLGQNARGLIEEYYSYSQIGQKCSELYEKTLSDIKSQRS